MGARHRAAQSGFGALLVFGCSAAILTASAVGLGAGDCASATRDLEQAQQALAKALRDADTLGDAYASCMDRGAACTAQKTAYQAACSARKKANAALKAASSARDLVCTK